MQSRRVWRHQFKAIAKTEIRSHTAMVKSTKHDVMKTMIAVSDLSAEDEENEKEGR